MILTLIAAGQPFAGFIASFYTHEEDVKEVVKQLLWLDALFMPIWSLSWTSPALLKAPVTYATPCGVSMLGMWGCRVVGGLCPGHRAGDGGDSASGRDGMVLDWAVRGVLFYFRMVSGRCAVGISAREGFIGRQACAVCEAERRFFAQSEE